MCKHLTEPKPKPVTKPDTQQSIPIATIEAKQAELLGIKHQLEFQLNGVVNQLHLIDQLLHPEPPPAPDNTI